MRLTSLVRLGREPAALSGRAMNGLVRLLVRFRYPVSLPEEVACALGIEMSNRCTFKQFLSCLSNPSCCPAKIKRLMPRHHAESLFETALRKEQHSLFSYYFKGAWMEFILHFDDQSRLRRLYLQHRDLGGDVEIALTSL
jgi:hypothetical protein